MLLEIELPKALLAVVDAAAKASNITREEFIKQAARERMDSLGVTVSEKLKATVADAARNMGISIAEFVRRASAEGVPYFERVIQPGKSHDASVEPVTARRRALTPEEESIELGILEYVARDKRESVENVVRMWFKGRAADETLETAFQEITRGELNGVMRFLMKLRRIPEAPAGVEGMVLVSEAARSDAWTAVAKFETMQRKAFALFHLLHGECAAEESEGVMGGSNQEDLEVGIMCLCQDMIAEMDACYDAAHNAMRALNKSKVALEGGV